MDARVPMPEELDLSAYRAHGLLPGETPIVDPSGDSGSGSASAGGSGSGDGPIVPDETLVLQLMAMGFSGNNYPITTPSKPSYSAPNLFILILSLQPNSRHPNPLIVGHILPYHTTTCVKPLLNSNSTQPKLIQPNPHPNLTLTFTTENGCKRAAVATQNADVDTACSWVFEHMEDSDFNDPLPAHVPGTGAGPAAGDD